MATADLLPPPPAAPRRDPSPRLWSEAEFARMRQLGLFAGRDVELTAGVVCERGTGRPFVFTRKEYYALGDNHFFRDRRVQLIGGAILQESPMNPPHAVVVRLVTKAIERVFGYGYDVRVQLPIDLGLTSEPEPDVAVVSGSPRDYLVDHPKTALLVIEVSESTIEADTHEKASLYASGGIADYWVVDLTTDRVLVFRSPKPEIGSAFGQNYAPVSAHGRDDALTPLAAPNARVLVGDLLP
ncbi:MAG: Uma2 family endonuclease [Planctomycetes bacterium]|nr:Uma2 family endonuclease [Planctomycetota bacterium]